MLLRYRAGSAEGSDQSRFCQAILKGLQSPSPGLERSDYPGIIWTSLNPERVESNPHPIPLIPFQFGNSVILPKIRKKSLAPFADYEMILVPRKTGGASLSSEMLSAGYE
ncbi:MAG TPA: hypothetical protein VGC39_08585 [Candidatus Methylacidiphilales bacterium]